MARNGYIKLHRKIADWGWYQEPNTFRVFIHLLIMASYDNHDFRGQDLKPGQVICGRKQLAEDLGMSERAVRTALNHLKTTNEVTIKTTNKFSIITIENWGKYQCRNDETDQQNDQQDGQQPTNNRPHRRSEEVENSIGGRAPRRRKNDLEETYAMMEEWANEHN